MTRHLKNPLVLAAIVVVGYLLWQKYRQNAPVQLNRSQLSPILSAGGDPVRLATRPTTLRLATL